MARYKKFEHLPWWLNNLNDNTLRPTEKEVLDLDYYCKKHGTKLSHDKAAEKLDRSRQTVYYARRRLEQLALRSTEPAKGSFKLGHPIEYQNEAEFLAQLRARGIDPRRSKNERKCLRKNISKQRIYSSFDLSDAAPGRAAGVSSAQTPQGSVVQGGAGAEDCSTDRETRGWTNSAKSKAMWADRRNHPQWKKYRHWGFGMRMEIAQAREHADYLFSQWLKKQETPQKV